MKEIQWIKTRENVRCEEKGMLREARGQMKVWEEDRRERRSRLSRKTVRKKQFGICTKNIGKRRSDQKNNAGRNGYSDETRVGKCEETV